MQTTLQSEAMSLISSHSETDRQPNRGTFIASVEGLASARPESIVSLPVPLRNQVVLRMQRQYGNRYVQRLLRRCASEGNRERDASETLASQLSASKRQGSALEEGTRTRLEPLMGHSFDHITVHSDAQAAHLAKSVDAHAFTIGHDIYFGAGKYQPTTDEGLGLLAHELTHTIQQSQGPGSGVMHHSGALVSSPGDSFELEAEHTAESVESRLPATSGEALSSGNAHRSVSTPASTSILQRNSEPEAEAGQSTLASAPVTWGNGPSIGASVLLPEDEAARRVNEALDVMGDGLTYVNRPPANDLRVAEANREQSAASNPVQTLRRTGTGVLQRDGASSSPLANVHGGVVGSLQFCWDCLTGEASIVGWIWAGVGYEAHVLGRGMWFGGYYFGERRWWSGNAGNLFQPGTCAPGCESSNDASERGWGIAGFPILVEPGKRARFSRGGLEIGGLLTPHSLCSADLEIIALLNVLGYLGPVATILTRAVDGANRITKGTPTLSLEAGIDVSTTFHLCRGSESLLTLSSANLCAGGFVGAGVGLSHEKSGNHGAV